MIPLIVWTDSRGINGLSLALSMRLNATVRRLPVPVPLGFPTPSLDNAPGIIAKPDGKAITLSGLDPFARYVNADSSSGA